MQNGAERASEREAGERERTDLAGEGVAFLVCERPPVHSLSLILGIQYEILTIFLLIRSLKVCF